jgi:hypothetical protein
LVRMAGFKVDENLNLRLARKLKVSKWRILDGNVDSDLMSDSELLGGSPHPCWLRNDRLA